MKRLKSAILALPFAALSSAVLAQVYEPPLDTPFNVRTPPPIVALPKTPVPSIVAIPPSNGGSRQSEPQKVIKPALSNAHISPTSPSGSASELETPTSTVIDRSAYAERPQTAPSASPSPSYAPGQQLVGAGKAYDGHTLLVNGHPVRLNGIEAPGLGQTCYTSSMTVWRCGDRALQRLSSLISGEKVSCTVTSAVGHGAAAICSVRGIRDLGAILVEEGLAIPNPQGTSLYNKHVISAKNGKIGIWAGSFEDPREWRKRNP